MSSGETLAQQAAARKLARDIGSVITVSQRRSDPDADHRQMIARLKEWEKQVWDLLAALQQAQAPQLIAERDAYKRDFEAELAGNARMRERLGARPDETMFAFVDRLEQQLQQAQAPQSELTSDGGSLNGPSRLGASQNTDTGGEIARQPQAPAPAWQEEVAARAREDALRALASATRKVLSPELVALVEAEMRRGLAAQYGVCGNWTPLKAAEVAAAPPVGGDSGGSAMKKIVIECKDVPGLTVEHLAKRIAEIADTMTAGAAKVFVDDKRVYSE